MNTLKYARFELNKYVYLVTGAENNLISLEIDEKILESSAKADFIFDDGYKIEINNGAGKIIGSNERSVLLGVYKMFNMLGCRFYTPNKLNELIPSVKLEDINIDFFEAPAYRHRGICIEGSVSLENVLDIIEWAPKVGFNSYFIQFRTAHTFFERWYTHEDNENVTAISFTKQTSIEFTAIIIAEIKKRGMLFHYVGHGWTSECLGIDSVGWHKVSDDDIDEDKREFLAELNGKRGFYIDTPINTNLCYSNAIAMNLLVNEITEYILKNNYIDVLHFWLADYNNNVCECENCKKSSLSDFYVKMLNRIDEILTRKQNKTKIAFLIYLELLWTPIEEKILNKDRFIMMYAPISRTYTRSFLNDGILPDRNDCIRPEYIYNKTVMPSQLEANLAFLYEWQKVFDGDSFIFEYHMMWDIYRDYSNLHLAKVLHLDLLAYKKLNMNGYISCQVQRAFFPVGLSAYLLGINLVNPNISYEEIKSDFFKNSYGDNADFVDEFLLKIQSSMDFEYFRTEKPLINASVEKNCKNFLAQLDYYKTSFENLSTTKSRIIADNMKAFVVLCDILLLLIPLLINKASGMDLECIKKDLIAARKKIFQLEPLVQGIVDMKFLNSVAFDFFLAKW